MDKRKGFGGSWILLTVHMCSLLLLAQACTVDNGQFLTTISVEEETEIGSVVGSLNFDNPESIARAKVVETNPYFDYLPANNSFVVTARIDVDEGLPTVQSMTIACMSKNGPQLPIEVEFELSDINDFTPEFSPSDQYTFPVSEAAILDTQIAVIEAKDRDIRNSHIEYELAATPYSDLFYVKDISGGRMALCLAESLDYESLRTYNLTIIAKDCQRRQHCADGQRNSTAHVTIEVLDADDLSPEFENAPYKVSIFEDSVEGTVVVQLVARDQDGLNAAIVYSINGAGSQFFAVDINTGMVKVKDTAGMVRGTQYLLHAKAEQADDTTKRTSTTLIIKVVATNGNAPQFSESSYDVTVSESSPMNTSVVAFHVVDRDTVSQLEFDITQSPEDLPFKLVVTEWNAAELRVAAPLDYEMVKFYTLTVQVSDGEYMSKADVYIRVLNENDHNPQFDKTDYSFEIEWEMSALVGTVRATDQDSEGEENAVTYQILSPYNSIFNINNKGEITISGSMSQYARSEYQINVQAIDNGKAPRSTTVAVQILLNFVDIGGTSDSIKTPGSKGGTNLAVYVVAAIAGVLLILVALLIMCFLKRRKAKKTAKQLRKDAENSNFDKPYALQATDTLNSSTDSNMTYQTQTTGVVADQQTLNSRLDLDSTENSGAHPLGAVDLVSCQNYSVPNNLSVVTDSQLIREVSHDTITNIPAMPATQTITAKCSSDSGRSSMREDRSPYMKRVPFQSFLHPKSASIDDSGNHSQDEEISMATFQRRDQVVHAHSGSLTSDCSRPDISNIRATEGPPIRAAVAPSSLNHSGYITEVPEGFRSSGSRHTSSPHCRTSDYESNTPTPEISCNSMIDYCADLPTQMRGAKPGLQRNNSYSDNEAYSSRPTIGSLYSDKPAGLTSTGLHRSDTPCSEVSTESDSTTTAAGERNNRPQMTIYF